MSWPYEDDDEGRVYGEQETSYHPGSYASTNATRLRAHTFRPGRGERSFIVDAPPVAVPWASLPSHRTWEPRQRPRRVSDPAYGRGYDDFDGRPHPDELGVPVPSSGRLDPRNVHAPPKTPSHHRDDGPTPHRAPARPEKGKPAKMADPDPTEPYDEKVAFQPTSHHHSRFSHHHHHPQQYAAPRRHASVVIEDPNDPTHELTAEDLTRTQSPSRSSSVPKVPRLSREGRDDEALRVDHFADAHGTEKKASGDHVQEAHQPLSWRHLFKRPIIRQWLRGGSLFRGVDRETTYVELFFDLMFVGIIHQLAEGAVEPVSRESVAKFILSFYPSWSVWSDVRNFVNHSGVDDVPQRIYILATMLLLVGYSSMISSIELEPIEPAEVEHSASLASEAFRSESLATRYHLVDFHDALQAAVSFLLAAKLLRLSLYLLYAYKLPRFRKSLLLSALQFLLPCALWFPLLWVTSQGTVVGLAAAAIGVELGGRYVVGIVARLDRKRAYLGGHDWFVPALSIEHMIDRISAFIVLVLGESIINSTYTASEGSGQIGIHAEYGRAAFAVCISFLLMLLYFDCDASRAFIHALRRHWLTSIANIQLHWPLSAGLILMSAALPTMVSERTSEMGFRWYFAGGTAVALLCTALIGWMHLSLDAPHTSILPRRLRLFSRVVVAIFIACMPLFMPESNLAILGVVAGILTALLIIETAGKLGAESIESVDILNAPPGKGRSRWGSRWGHGIRKEDLTDAELGEEDVGVEEGLSHVQIRTVQPHQRLAYTS